MKKTILSLALLAASALSVHAGGILDDLKYDLRAGYNIGGTMPMGMPASIRSLDAYRPTLSVMLGLGVYKPLTDKWGLTTGSRLENKGMDIATERNSAVKCVFNGVVQQVVVIPGYNQCVLIQHGNYFSFYCKLKSVCVKAGTKVTTGQEIGTVDTIGGETQLHFEIWQNDKPQNPELWLR